MNKQELRNKVKQIRKNIDISRKSLLAVNKIRCHEFYQNANNIMIYYPLKYEINLLDLLEDDKNFYLPKVEGDNLSVCPFSLSDKLIKSKLSILEPCTNPVSSDILDLIIVPALAADENNYRLGYGGGFYDRFLADKHVKTICVIPSELFFKSVPAEEFDVRADDIVVV